MIHSFTLGSRKYQYTLGQPFIKEGEKLMHFCCKTLGIDQDFLLEDIPELILDLPNMAHNLQESRKQESFIRLRVRADDKKIIEKKASAAGKTTSAYIREKALGN